MANSNNPYAFSAPHQDQSSLNQNYLQQPMQNPEDITDPTTAMNMALALMAKAFKLKYSTPTNNNQIISSNPRNRQIAQLGNPTGYNDVIGNQVIQNVVQNPRVQNVGNPNGLMGVQGNENQNQFGNGNLVAARAEGNAAGQNGNQIRCYNCRGIGQNEGNPTGYNDVIGNQVIQNGLIGVQRNGNQNQIGNGNLVVARVEGNATGQNGNQIRCYNCRGLGHYARNCTVRPKRRDAA
nr:hypothetical protein [Tanacetum cinerariifolium]